jgi:hypothetical protein
MQQTRTSLLQNQILSVAESWTPARTPNDISVATTIRFNNHNRASWNSPTNFRFIIFSPPPALRCA